MKENIDGFNHNIIFGWKGDMYYEEYFESDVEKQQRENLEEILDTKISCTKPIKTISYNLKLENL